MCFADAANMITLKTRIYFLTILLQSVTVFSIFSPDSYYSYNGNHAYQYNLTGTVTLVSIDFNVTAFVHKYTIFQI